VAAPALAGGAMKPYSAFNASHFSRSNSNRKAPLWWGIIGLIVIETTVVATFIASYFYLRMGAVVWPPPGVAPPDLLWPTINMIVLLASAAAMWAAGQAMNRNRKNLFSVLIALSLVLASSALVFRWQQFQDLDFRWDSHAYGSIVWTITGFHFIHVVSAVIGTAVVFILSLMKYFDKDRQLAVVVDTMYWYFVMFAWVPFYVVLYWGPRLL
jgi:cytochrome c oxidase subunit 3